MSPLPGRVACPICAKAPEPGLEPFCSQRCADIDLGRWLSDRYVIPAEDEEDAQPAPGPETD